MNRLIAGKPDNTVTVHEPRLLQAFMDLTGVDPTACAVVEREQLPVLERHANWIETRAAIEAARRGRLVTTGSVAATLHELNN